MQVQSVITFSQAEVQKILADYINNNFAVDTPVVPNTVKFNVNAGYDGRMEYCPPSLTSAEVKVTIGSIKK